MARIETFSLRETDFEESAEAQKFKGRGKVISMEKVRLQSKTDLTDEVRIAAGYGYAARFLATVAEVTKKIGMLASKASVGKVSSEEEPSAIEESARGKEGKAKRIAQAEESQKGKAKEVKSLRRVLVGVFEP